MIQLSKNEKESRQLYTHTKIHDPFWGCDKDCQTNRKLAQASKPESPVGKGTGRFVEIGRNGKHGSRRKKCPDQCLCGIWWERPGISCFPYNRYWKNSPLYRSNLWDVPRNWGRFQKYKVQLYIFSYSYDNS